MNYLMQPAEIKYQTGMKEWRLPDGTLHRYEGPALIYPFGREEWYLHGQLHRSDGPAVSLSDGTEEWWIYGKKLTNGEIIALKMKLWLTQKEDTHEDLS